MMHVGGWKQILWWKSSPLLATLRKSSHRLCNHPAGLKQNYLRSVNDDLGVSHWGRAVAIRKSKDCCLEFAAEIMLLSQLLTMQAVQQDNLARIMKKSFWQYSNYTFLNQVPVLILIFEMNSENLKLFLNSLTLHITLDCRIHKTLVEAQKTIKKPMHNLILKSSKYPLTKTSRISIKDNPVTNFASPFCLFV